MSTRRFHSTYSTKQKPGTNGRLACLQCEGDITAKARRTFCGKYCADIFRLKTSAMHARFMVFERDNGVCAKCGVNVFDAAVATPQAEKEVL